MLLFVPALLVLLILQGRAQLLDEHRQHLVQRVHHASLQPLGNRGPGVVEAQLLQDVVHAHRVDLTPRPGDEPEGERKSFVWKSVLITAELFPLRTHLFFTNYMSPNVLSNCR